MKELTSLYIERNDCNNCCKCLRECPQKAIVNTADGIEIDPLYCIECGSCLAMCKMNAVKLRDDLHIAREIMQSADIKIASLSPQWITEFPDMPSGVLIKALRSIGFDHISESALGAQQTIAEEMRLARMSKGVSISARCPAVVEYIHKYKPHLSGLILPVVSPMVAHARMIKKIWGKQSKVVYICACAAGKSEAERNPNIDLVLTYKELKKWFKNEGVSVEKIKDYSDCYFEPQAARSGIEYPLCITKAEGDDGILRIGESEMAGVRDLLDKPFPMDKTPVFLDLMACRGGCIGSNGRTEIKHSQIEDLLTFKSYINSVNGEANTGLPVVELDIPPYSTLPINNFVPEAATVNALDELGIPTPAQQTDCNGCGYGTCRRFAKALTKGKVSKDMCVYYLKNELSTKFSTLINKMSSGVAIVNDSMRIEEANRMIASMMSPEVEYMFDHKGIKGENVNDVFPFSGLISSVLENGDETLVRDVQIKERIVTVSIHTIQKYKTVLVICRNMLFSQVRNEEIVSRTQKVIKENLDTVQKIAYMLGENASRTEAMLNSILNSQSQGNGE